MTDWLLSTAQSWFTSASTSSALGGATIIGKLATSALLAPMNPHYHSYGGTELTSPPHPPSPDNNNYHGHPGQGGPHHNRMHPSNGHAINTLGELLNTIIQILRPVYRCIQGWNKYLVLLSGLHIKFLGHISKYASQIVTWSWDGGEIQQRLFGCSLRPLPQGKFVRSLEGAQERAIDDSLYPIIELNEPVAIALMEFNS